MIKTSDVLKPVDVFNAILNTDVSSAAVCNHKPVEVMDPAVFIVNLNSLKNPNDIKADDMGSWIHKGKPIRYFELDQGDDGEVLLAKPCSSEDSNYYKLTRVYYHHKGTPQFRKTLFYVTGMS
jgi:hypothetical protein